MKLRNILASFLAVAAMAVSCTEELTGSLSSISLDQSTIVFPETGSSVTITVTAQADWSVDAATVPAEVTVTPMSGTAGETKMTISTNGGSANDITAEIVILVGQQKQFIKFYQPGDPALKPKFEEFVAGDYWIMCPEGDEWFALKSTGCTIDDSGSYNYLYSVPAVVAEDGSLSSTASNVFTFEAVDGGFIIKDPAGGYLYQVAKYHNFYLTSKKEEASVWTVTQVSDDEFMLEIPELSKWMQYSTSYDSAGAYPSAQDGATLPMLVKAEEPAVEPFVIEKTEFELGLEAGEILIPVVYNGTDIHVDGLPEWLTFYGYHDGEIKFTYLSNDAGTREAVVVLTTCMEDGRECTVELTFTQEGSIVELTVAEFLAAAEGAALYKLTGVVKNIANTTYGNFDLVDATGSVYVYGLTNNGAIGSNDKTFASLGINEGDVVTIIGTRTSYKDVPQVGGTAYLVSHVAATESTVADFLAQSVASDKWYKLTGMVSNIASDVYGNFDLVDETGSVYVYGLTVAPVAKNDKSFAQLGLKEGDIVTLVGTRAEYNGAAQVGGPAYYISHEEGAPAVDPWETAAVFTNPADGDDAKVKELKAYADADYLYVRITSVKEAPCFANYFDVQFTDGEGETAVWWGWTTKGTKTYYQEHKNELDENGNITKMRWYTDPDTRVYVDDYTTTISDTEVVWEFKYPRTYIDAYKSSTNTVHMAVMTWKDWDGYWVIPARGNEMLEVTLP